MPTSSAAMVVNLLHNRGCGSLRICFLRACVAISLPSSLPEVPLGGSLANLWHLRERPVDGFLPNHGWWNTCKG